MKPFGQKAQDSSNGLQEVGMSGMSQVSLESSISHPYSYLKRAKKHKGYKNFTFNTISLIGISHVIQIIEKVYREVATLISSFKKHPYNLLQVFRLCNRCLTDESRQHLLFILDEFVSSLSDPNSNVDQVLPSNPQRHSSSQSTGRYDGTIFL
jgi:hypothetical protein